MKKLLIGIIVLIGLARAVPSHAQVPPSFDDNFADYLRDDTPDQDGRSESVFWLCIDREQSLMDNVRRLFYPNPINYTGSCAASAGWEIWDTIRILWWWLLFVMLVRTGIMFIFSNNEEEKLKKAKNNILYILYGAWLLFGATWILGSVLNIWQIQGTGQLASRLENGVLFQVLSIFKAAAFFIAIVLMVVYGFKIMAAMDKEEKLANTKRWIISVLVTLVFIKIIDYVFFIAATPEFGESAGNLIIEVATVLWYILGWLIMIIFFYIGFLLLTSSGNEERIGKAKKALIAIVVSAMVIFLFLLILFQLFNEFS